MSERRSSGQGQSTLGYLFGESDELGKKDNDQSKVSSISGGGPSSLGYLFGSNALEQQSSQESKLSSTRPVCVPPYGTDDVKENSQEKRLCPPSKDDDHNSVDTSFVYHKVDGENSKDFLMTGRPSIRVTSVPGGDSSVGYLFGDK
ncbi:hypothetical protein CTI12_AA194830 [Artemisia annua]|uniref:Protein SPIRAL1-like 5 n=1 Tax=Artemisia annua TaxID=35608 RepID=A0A2U1P486_ARTAN|nr:hypothetical protein CTI12_AA194830 [Artemisia annua]